MLSLDWYNLITGKIHFINYLIFKFYENYIRNKKIENSGAEKVLSIISSELTVRREINVISFDNIGSIL